MTPPRREELAQRVQQRNISCTSMVVTVFGDVLSQHGGWVWLGSLIDLLGHLGYNERLVRTAVFRLVQQNWLQVSRVGRRSYYCFTDSGRSQFERAARRVYSAKVPDWDGNWTLVSPVDVDDEQREIFRKNLIWLGYNTLVNGLLAYPSADRSALNETIADMKLAGKVLVFTATTEEGTSSELLKKMVREKWNLKELESDFSEFLAFYRPVAKKLSAISGNGLDQLLLRLVLIHEYRRILLRDPDFPVDMLPSGWVGFEAQQATSRIYNALKTNSVDHILQSMENAQGALPAPDKPFFNRFN